MTNPHLIKKYPNRRLYDTRSSSYITLADVKTLVQDGDAFIVADAKSGEDLTRNILLQIIQEEGSEASPGLTIASLKVLIRSSGNTAQAMLGRYLENQIASFEEMQARLSAHASTLYGDAAAMHTQEMWAQFLSLQGSATQTLLSAYIEQSQKMLEQMQAQSRQLAGEFTPSRPQSPAP